MREYAKELREMMDKGESEVTIQEKIRSQMAVVYRVVGICLGIPNDTFVWEYYDKAKAYQSIGPITPNEFYNKYVKPVYNVNDKVYRNRPTKNAPNAND